VSRDLVQLWSAPQCQAGAVALGPLTTWTSARVSLADGSPPALSLAGVLRAELAAADAREGCALRVVSPTRGVAWWVVTQITDAATQDTAAVRCAPLRTLLALRGLVRVGSVYAFTPPADVSLAWLVREYVLSTGELTGRRAELAEDGLDWITLRTIDEPSAPIVLPPFSAQTRGQVLATLEQLAQRTAVLVPRDALGATGFWMDVLRDPTAALAETRLSEGVDLISADRTRDVQRAPSVVVPFGSNARTLGMTEWEVTAIDGAGPAWVTLRDPSATEDRWPIREDGQLVGAFVRLALGDTREILDSRASDSAVEMASVSGLTVGDRVGLVLDADSTPLDEIVSPSRVTRTGRVVATQVAQGVTLARNVVRGSLLQGWTDATTPAHWSLAGSIGVVRYPRIESVTAYSWELDGARVAGNTAINLRGGLPGQRLYGSEFLSFGAGGSREIATPYVEFDSDGKASLTLATGLGANVADGAVVAAQHVLSASSFTPKRPFYTLLTRDNDPTFALRFRTQASTATWPVPATDDRVQSAPVRVHLQSARPELNVVRAACGLSMTYGPSSFEFGNFDGSFAVTDDVGSIGAAGRRMPALLLVGDPTGTPTRLASAIIGPRIVGGSIVNTVLTCQHTITADTTVALAVTPPRLAPTFAHLPFTILRWASLWLGDEAEPPIVDGSPSNPAWHAAQDALAAGAARWRLRGVDLAALVREGQPLALGQRVRLSVPSLAEDGRWRIVRLDWSLDDVETVDVELGAVTPRLTAVTVSV
jgi:hypothetical protein